MKKFFISSLLILCCGAFYAGLGLASITDNTNPHNFTATGSYYYSLDTTEYCIFCHTPHGAIVRDPVTNAAQALWNRSLHDGESFTMYSSPTFSATFADPSPSNKKPTGFSLLCLSCHDGVSSIGLIVNYPSGVTSITMYPQDSFGPEDTFPSWANPTIGRNLSNDHPISIIYDDDLVSKYGTALRSPQGVMDNTPLRLYQNGLGGPRVLLECPTCHDPHEWEANAKPFLRMSNAGSAMCLSCHNK